MSEHTTRSADRQAAAEAGGPGVRPAWPDDVPPIHKMITEAAKNVPVIPRSRFELYQTLRDFFVYDEGAGVQGCCALHITWSDLAEVKSLVVDPALRGRGVGRRLVEACLEEARRIGLERVFALTSVPEFFEKLGFERIDRAELPQKVWGECMRCPKYPDECNEEAVMYHIGEAGKADSH